MSGYVVKSFPNEYIDGFVAALDENEAHTKAEEELKKETLVFQHGNKQEISILISRINEN
jgi:hypothetical protein